MKLTGSMSKLKLAVGGALAGFGAVEIAKGLGIVIDKTKDLSHELALVQKHGSLSLGDRAAMWKNVTSICHSGASIQGHRQHVDDP
jgi:hypothetical protein